MALTLLWKLSLVTLNWQADPNATTHPLVVFLVSALINHVTGLLTLGVRLVETPARLC